MTHLEDLVRVQDDPERMMFFVEEDDIGNRKSFILFGRDVVDRLLKFLRGWR